MAATKTTTTKRKRRSHRSKVHGPTVTREAATEGNVSLTDATETEAGASPPAPGSVSGSGLASGLDGLGSEDEQERTSGPEPSGSGSDKPVPSETDAFENVLRIMGVNETYIKPITMYCAQENLKDLVRLDKNLWDMGIANIHLRRRTINYWARSMGLAVPQQLTQQFIQHDPSGAPDITRGIATSSNQKWYVEDEGTGIPKLRPVKLGEQGMTLDEAKLAIKEMRQQGGQGNEPIVEFNPDIQQWVPNQKSAWVQGNLQAAWMTARDYNRQMQEGVQQDPLDVMTEQLAKVAQVKASLGIKEEQGNKTDIVQMIEAMGKMDEIARNRLGQGGQPAWMNDPVTFMTTIKSLNPQPTGPDPAIMAALNDAKEEAKSARAESLALKEQMQNERMEALKTQNQTIITELGQVRAELAKPRGEATAMGIMDKGLGVGKEELSGLRKDIKDIATMALSGGPPAQSPASRADRAASMRGALADADRLEALTDVLDLALKGG